MFDTVARAFRLQNAARARIKGIEVETVIRPFDGFQLDGSYAWLDAKFPA